MKLWRWITGLHRHRWERFFTDHEQDVTRLSELLGGRFIYQETYLKCVVCGKRKDSVIGPTRFQSFEQLAAETELVNVRRVGETHARYVRLPH